MSIAEVTGDILLGYSGLAGILLVALLVITRKIVWHTDLKACEDRAEARVRTLEDERDRWQGFALDLLGTANKLTVHAEVANEIITRLPDPMQPNRVARPRLPDTTPEQ